MAELLGINLGLHLESILAEWQSQKTIYGYPEKKIYKGFEGFDFSVNFHGKKAATPLGPASGPHTQMAQNILLSFLGGGRIMELKTIQILDELEIPRPCIDARNICFNVEWSQELKLEASYQEYVTAWVLLKILEEMELLGIPKGDPFYHTIFDISVGYDLKGISSAPVKKWIQKMMNGEEAISQILDSLPSKFSRYKKLSIPSEMATSATLSTFHGCPRDEIEAIVKHLIGEHGLHVIVKMNPTLLGYDFVRKTLCEDLGYTQIELDPKAFEHDLQFDEAVSMMKRLEEFGKKYGRNVGAKFTNTLVVKNREKVFQDQIMYMSGEPLHVLSMNTMDRFRRAMGDHIPVSFSAGISKYNVVDAILCNMKPVSVCTDLLRTGGYSRLYSYLENLRQAMEKEECKTLVDFICKKGDGNNLSKSGSNNASTIVPALVKNPLYHFHKNQKEPRKINKDLHLLDCVTCDKCIPVCPNGANFSFFSGASKTPMVHYKYEKGAFLPAGEEEFVVEQEYQIGNLADFCNECGNCDTFCPESGGPFIEKPRFFHSRENYEKYSRTNGFYFTSPSSLKGKIQGIEYELSWNSEKEIFTWKSESAEIQMDEKNQWISGKALQSMKEGEVLSMKPYYLFKTFLLGLTKNPEHYPAIILKKGHAFTRFSKDTNERR